MQVRDTRLKRERMGQGIKQREFAALLGVAPATLSVIENGHRPPWPKLRRDAARLLGLDEADLFREERCETCGAQVEALAIRALERLLAEHYIEQTG